MHAEFSTARAKSLMFPADGTPLASRPGDDFLGGMHHWLMKTEPESFSIDTLKKQGVAPWDGVRNYTARNFMQQMALGDQVLIYHSNITPPGIAGLATVEKLAYPDHTQFDPTSIYYDPKATKEKPRWFMVQVRYVSHLKFLSRPEIQGIPELAEMRMFKENRLSVTPVTAEEFAVIMDFCQPRDVVAKKKKTKGA